MTPVIKSEPLHIQAYNHIKHLILNNEFVPGEQLTEVKLANKLGISRGPVREAMRMLLQDGLVNQKGAYTYVLDLTVEDAIDLYLCRESLESLAARLAAQNMSQDDQHQLEVILDQTKTALGSNHMGEVVALNTQFHDLIVRASGNEQLIQLLKVISAKTVYLRNCILKHFTRSNDFIEEHENIVHAILEQNDDQVEGLMKQHIQNDLQAICTFFEDKTTQQKGE
ncbi:GntR family transcriptional regulator [Tuberibacillus sp. Marseille-P3662]|uniref:GntR family transcriptional regulator n=1 Tax=Tuberibacillus sp. Marseille-P3662 TaxID=1965358 RepID=UPI0015943816|nr:GntR family transcriptional regulator [Tuberibacillus sp. Marseille-P3662]